MPWYDPVLARFDLPERQTQASRGRWTAYCPAHEADGDGHTPSLGLEVGRDGTRLLVRCRAGCGKADVLHAVGLKMSDLFLPDTKEGRKAWAKAPRIVAAYDYLDDLGVRLYQAVRLEPKSFRQRHEDAAGYWVWGRGETRLVPYRLPHILARPEQPVVVVEGEKDADALADAYGLEATTGIGGCGEGWHDAYSVALCSGGRRFALVPDQDRPGLAYMERVAGSLLRFGAAGVRWVDLPKPHKDVSEALAAGVDVLGVIRGNGEYRR